MMKFVFALIALVSVQSAFAGQGDTCMRTYRKLGYGSNMTDEQLVNWCNQNGYTEAHSEVVELFVGKTSWNANQLFDWAKRNEFTGAHVDATRDYVRLGSTTGIADILLYCKGQNFTAKQVRCARKGNPNSVNNLTEWSSYCKNQ